MKPALKDVKRNIGEQLVEAGTITRGQLGEALAVQQKEGGTIVSILLSFNHLTPAKIDQFLAENPGVPSIELRNCVVPKEVIDFIPREFAIKNQVFPIDKLGKLLTVGMVFPLDSETISQIEQMCSLRVKAFLCNPSDIRRAIEHYYSPVSELRGQVAHAEMITTGVRVENIAQLIQKIDALPPLPSTVQKVQEASRSANVNLKEIAGIVSQDPVISARLLKLANSSAYGFKHSVDDIELAVSLLGLKAIASAVLSAAVMEMTEKAGNFDNAAFSRRSMLCAGAARRIGMISGFKNNPGIFTAGLLCEIGRFALAQCAPARYEKIPAGLDDVSLCNAEEKLFGVGHPEAAYMLAEQWELPGELSEPIRYHLAPERAVAFPKQTAVIALAARLCDGHMEGVKDFAAMLDGFDDALMQLGVTAEAIVTIYAELVVDATR